MFDPEEITPDETLAPEQEDNLDPEETSEEEAEELEEEPEAEEPEEEPAWLELFANLEEIGELTPEQRKELAKFKAPADGLKAYLEVQKEKGRLANEIGQLKKQLQEKEPEPEGDPEEPEASNERTWDDVAQVPIEDRGEDLAWRYYAKGKGYTEEEIDALSNSDWAHIGREMRQDLQAAKARQAQDAEVKKQNDAALAEFQEANPDLAGEEGKKYLSIAAHLLTETPELAEAFYSLSEEEIQEKLAKKARYLKNFYADEETPKVKAKTPPSGNLSSVGNGTGKSGGSKETGDSWGIVRV